MMMTACHCRLISCPFASTIVVEGWSGSSPSRLFSKRMFPLSFISEWLFNNRHFTSFALFPGFDAFLCFLAAVTEAIGIIAGFDDVTVMRQSIQQCCGHLCVAEDTGP